MNTNSRSAFFYVPTLGISFLAIICARADALDNWTTNQVSTNSFQLRQVIYGNGLYIAAGGKLDGGAIESSEDGLNWTLRADGGTCCNPSLVSALASGGGRFVTVGHFGGTASSINGSNWAFGYAASIQLYGVAYGVGKFVAVGNGSLENTTNSIFSSTDGITWIARSKSPVEVRDVYDVAYGSGRFVAIAAAGYTYTSADGNAWTRSSATVNAAINRFSTITFCNSLFFITVNGTNYLSPTGLTWTPVATGVTNIFGRPLYVGGFYLVRSGMYLATSTDGTNWMLRSSSMLPGDSDIASDGKRLVTVGNTVVTPFSSYNAYTYVSDPLAGIGIANGSPPQIVLSGVVGRIYRIEHLPFLPSAGTNIWQVLTNLTLTSSPFLITDPQMPIPIQRYYRAVLTP